MTVPAGREHRSKKKQQQQRNVLTAARGALLRGRTLFFLAGAGMFQKVVGWSRRFSSTFLMFPSRYFHALHSNKKSKSNDYRTFDINSKIESSKYDEELNGVEHLKKEPVLELS